ncbi:heterodisulfide reductase-related iron-sulfur binding cluster [Candidatus Nitrospira salsa]
MKGFELITPGWDRPQLEAETLRVFDICDGCRRCFNLCPSFNTLIDRIDDYDNDVNKFTAKDFEQVEQECYYCKLCFNHCPYSPPHKYEIDFPRLMAAWKKQRIAEKGATWRDRLLIQTDLIGKVGTLTAPMTNWALRTPWVRKLMEHVMGVHRDRQILPFQQESFPSWWSKQSPSSAKPETKRKVALFPSCMVNHQATDIGKATVQVLEKNGIEVAVPEGQQCCGMPRFDLGDTDNMIETAKANYEIFRPYLESGHDIIVPTASCSLMLKREYPYLLPDHGPIKDMAERTFDVCEYLMKLKKEGTLSVDFPENPGRIAYQIPCHLRDQNIGFKSKELMELTGAKVQLIEKCSGHDGTWGAKVEFFDLSMKIAKKAVREVEEDAVDAVASDCPLSALQLDQVRGIPQDSNKTARHPIQIIRDSYGLSS